MTGITEPSCLGKAFEFLSWPASPTHEYIYIYSSTLALKVDNRLSIFRVSYDSISITRHTPSLSCTPLQDTHPHSHLLSSTLSLRTSMYIMYMHYILLLPRFLAHTLGKGECQRWLLLCTGSSNVTCVRLAGDYCYY